MSTNQSINIPNISLLGLKEIAFQGSAIGQATCVLYIDIIGFSKFEQQYGFHRSELVLCLLTISLQEITQEYFSSIRCNSIIHIWDDGYALLLQQSEVDAVFLPMIHQFVSALESALNRKLQSERLHGLRIRFGFSRAQGALNNPDAVYEHITRAGRIARRTEILPPQELVSEFYQILHSGNIQSLFQPIVGLKTRLPIGWECLTRGPVHSHLFSPVSLFECAAQLGHLFQLETLCRTSAIRQAKLPKETKLFVNISPNIFIDPDFKEGETRRLLEENNLSPHQVVFEITENQAIRDFDAFKQVISHYRNQGYQIAIDDTGAGYSGLVTLLEVKPDFIKIDMSIIREVHLDVTKQRIVSAITSIGKQIGALIIAEGIEQEEERTVLEACGVEFGQGYLFGRPADHQ